MMIKAFRLKTINQICYLTCLPVIDILDKMKVDEWNDSNRLGYQRALDPRRFGDGELSIVDGINQGLFNPSGVVVNTREKLVFNEESQIGNISIGHLDIPDYAHFWVIDGRHKLEAFKEISKEDRDYLYVPLGLTIYDTIDLGDETKLFYILNSSKLRLNHGIELRNIQNLGRHYGERYLYESMGLNGLLTFRAVELTDLFNTIENSPFKERICNYGQVKEKKHFLKDVDMVHIMKLLLKDYLYKDFDTISLKYINYWRYIKEMYKDCYMHNDKYSVFMYSGVYIFSLLFKDLDSKIVNSDVNNYSKYLSLLKTRTEKHPQTLFRKPIDSEVWKVDGDNKVFTTRNPQILNFVYSNIKRKIGL